VLAVIKMQTFAAVEKTSVNVTQRGKRESHDMINCCDWMSD